MSISLTRPDQISTELWELKFRNNSEFGKIYIITEYDKL